MAKGNTPVAVQMLFGDSWSLKHWPENVYPHSFKQGRYLVRCNLTSLDKAGVLRRIGRELVVLGDPYRKWLAANQHREAVSGFANNLTQREAS